MRFDGTHGRKCGSGYASIIEQEINENVDFAVSYTVESSFVCTKNVRANFDLTILGDVKADSLEVKGDFICLGACEVKKITVTGSFWAKKVRSQVLIVGETIMAEDIDSDLIESSESIIVKDCIGIEKKISTERNIICGEGIYGCGEICAEKLIVGEYNDVDGEISTETEGQVFKLTNETQPENELLAHYDSIIEQIQNNVRQMLKTHRWDETKTYLDGIKHIAYANRLLSDLIEVERCLKIEELDAYSFLKLHQIMESKSPLSISGRIIGSYFSLSTKIKKEIENGFFTAKVKCVLPTYRHFIDAIALIQRYSSSIQSALLMALIDKVYSQLGVKSYFLNKVFNEKGWKIDG